MGQANTRHCHRSVCLSVGAVVRISDEGALLTSGLADLEVDRPAERLNGGGARGGNHKEKLPQTPPWVLVRGS